MKSNNKTDNSGMLATIVTICLLFISILIPVLGVLGIIMMWVWPKWKKWVKILITIPFVIFVLLQVALLNYLFFLSPVQVKGTSMSPSYWNGQYLMTNKLSAVRRGDAVVYANPLNADQEFLSRIIGMPGETITIKEGQVFINGNKLDESKYIGWGTQTLGGKFIKDKEVKQIPLGYYFLMSDNRTNSTDSREFGFVPQKNINGKVSFCYWNCKK
jgi:signal peptidase I